MQPSKLLRNDEYGKFNRWLFNQGYVPNVETSTWQKNGEFYTTEQLIEIFEKPKETE
jgi:hypothetical protein